MRARISASRFASASSIAFTFASNFGRCASVRTPRTSAAVLRLDRGERRLLRVGDPLDAGHRLLERGHLPEPLPATHAPAAALRGEWDGGDGEQPGECEKTGDDAHGAASMAIGGGPVDDYPDGRRDRPDVTAREAAGLAGRS
ncbi:MAG: hypothetical protein MUF40_07520 [Gemmatimonadaceae bacterium]|nr:hypothetical protein [Gemmatimonadaceae bacterium]